MPLSRRRFLKNTLRTSAAASLAPSLVVLTPRPVKAAYGPGNQWPGRCVRNYDFRCQAGNNEAATKRMVDDSVKLLTGQATVGEAWKAVFPAALSLASKIAIKVNIVALAIPSHPFIVRGIIDGLVQMDFSGTPFPIANITVWDGNNNILFPSAGFSATLFPDVTLVNQNFIQTDHGDGARGLPYADALFNCDYLINVPSLRGHNDYVEKVTLGFKSHYGTYPAAETTTSVPYLGAHDAVEAPKYLRDINCLGPVPQKTVLTVLTAILANNENQPSGPQYPAESYLNFVKTMHPAATAPFPCTIMMSTDPVTLEFQAIKAMRLNRGNPYTVDSMPKYLRASAGITGLLDETYDIGIIDEGRMDVRDMVNGITAVEGTGAPAGQPGLRIFPNPANPQAFLEVVLPRDRAGEMAEIGIYSFRGAVVRRFRQRTLGRITRVAWDGRDAAGRTLAAGTYVAKVQVAGKTLMGKFTLVR